MRRAVPVHLEWDQRRRLSDLAQAGGTSPRISRRAAIVIRAAEGHTNLAIARELGISTAAVARWRQRFVAHGVAGVLHDAPRSGRPPVISASQVVDLIRTTLDEMPPGGRRWSARSLARRVGIGKSSVQRIWKSHGIERRARPPRPVSDGGLGFLERVTDLVGLYLYPPERAVAFSTDERVPPNPFRRPSSSRAIRARRRPSGGEFLAFLRMTERETPEVLDVHLLIERRFSPVPAAVRRWLSHHPRFHLHFLPPDPWGVGVFDRLIDGFSHRKDRPGASASALRLHDALQDHIRRDTDAGRPFVWTAASGDIRGAYGRRAIQQ